MRTANRHDKDLGVLSVDVVENMLRKDWVANRGSFSVLGPILGTTSLGAVLGENLGLVSRAPFFGGNCSKSLDVHLELYASVNKVASATRSDVLVLLFFRLWTVQIDLAYKG